MDKEKISIKQQFICPLSNQVMTDPVITVDGYTFDRKSIQEWFEIGHRTNPITKQTLPSLNVAPNILVKKMINNYESKQQRVSYFSQSVVNTFSNHSQEMFRHEQTQKKLINLRQSLKNFDKKWDQFEKNFFNWLDRYAERVNSFKHRKQFEDGEFISPVSCNIRNGEGYMRYHNGDRYWGEWKNDQEEGFGQMFDAEKEIRYFGEWKKGVLHGLGWTCHNSSPSVFLYRGQWENGCPNGIGVQYLKQSTFRGFWRNGDRYKMGQLIQDGIKTTIDLGENQQPEKPQNAIAASQASLFSFKGIKNQSQTSNIKVSQNKVEVNGQKMSRIKLNPQDFNIFTSHSFFQSVKPFEQKSHDKADEEEEKGSKQEQEMPENIYKKSDTSQREKTPETITSRRDNSCKCVIF